MPRFHTGSETIAYDVAGNGPPVLLLHGFPQTRALWDRLVPGLTGRYTVVTADLRGYGGSTKPAPLGDLSNYTFLAMGQDMLALMSDLGFDRFHLVGHDRGARVAHTMARAAPDRVTSLVLMDIVPTLYLLETWDIRIATAYFHWTYLAQPAPLPEDAILADPDAFFEACLTGWGAAELSEFPALDTYRAAWRDPATVSGMTNDYRAALGPDLDNERAWRGRAVTCPTQVLYGESGVVGRLYDVAEVWAPYLDNPNVSAIPGGHFFVDTAPDVTLNALLSFLP